MSDPTDPPDLAPPADGSVVAVDRDNPLSTAGWSHDHVAHFSKWVLGVLAVALVARLAYWVLATPDYVPISDAGHYFDLARNVAEGKGLVHTFPQLENHPTAFRPPLYPAVLGAVFWVLGPSITAARVVSLVLGLVVVLLAIVVARRIGGDRSALLAGAAAAVFPPLVFNDVMVLTEPISLALLLAMVWASIDGRVALSGAFGGLLVLARTSAQFLLPFVALWILWREGWRKALAFLGVGILFVAPWAVRNMVELDYPGLATSNGFNLAAMYSREAQDAGVFVDPVFHPGFSDMRVLQFDEGQWSDELQRRGLAGLRSNPLYVFNVGGRNTLAFLELKPSFNENAEILDGRNMAVRGALQWTVPVAIVVGVVGLWRNRRRPEVVLLAVVGGYFWASSILTIAAPRLRAPVDVIVCIGIGLLLARREPATA